MRHALIIGGTKGTGKVIAEMFRGKGFKISVFGRSAPEDSEVKDAFYRKIDLSSSKDIPSALKDVYEKNGPINYVVFCQRSREKENNWDNEIQISLTSTKRIIEYIASNKEMISPEDASVVFIGSIASKLVIPQPLSYHIAKSGLETMAIYYAVTLAHLGMRFNVIVPGTIVKPESKAYYDDNTELKGVFENNVPAGRMTTSEDITNLVEFLCDPKSKMITGQKIVIDGGISLIGQEGLLIKKLNENK